MAHIAVTPPAYDIKEQVQELIYNADQSLEYLKSVLISPNTGRKLDSGEKKLSIRSQARLSHFRLMAGKHVELSPPVSWFCLFSYIV
jgi:hypothetical protein